MIPLSAAYSLPVTVMPSAVRDIDAPVFHMIYQSILLIDPTAELTLQIPGKRLWFTDSFRTAISLDILYQFIDTRQCFLILFLPVEIIFPGII